MKVGKGCAPSVKRAAAAALATVLIGTGSAGASFAAAGQPSSDIQGHWAESTLQRWSQSGLLKGGANGRIEPNRPLTRSEWAALANRAFGYAEAGEVKFKDLPATSWAYDDIRKAVKAGYLVGFEDGTIRLASPVSRQEAAVMLARMLHLDAQPEAAGAATFADETAIPAWSRPAVHALAGEHLLIGYRDGSFKPRANITRAEAIVLLDKAVNRQPPSEGGTTPGGGGTTPGDGGTTPGEGTSPVAFFATDDPAVPQALRDYALVLAGRKTVDYTYPFQTSALAIVGKKGDANVVDGAGWMWAASGTTLKRFDPYAADPDAVKTFGDGTDFQGTIRALLTDNRHVWVLTDRNVSRIRYS
ncbi:S-layer homology domain-containing protein [Cohnella sp. REN36]|uniref:S-layer homology domain-containing protein n=1 Tax=Cohnella sp. REN36 TaxID=2887347 RepID=UPI001D15BDAE|nr:S-layer homology domain-containing protein [Cohnella sp. REN36]MCC3372911.1 S-layer homology domain-containing protein [Cohnella sp. REN36]